MGNWIVSPEEKVEKDEVWEKTFQEKCYEDLARARKEDEEEIREINATVASGMMSRGLADERIAIIRKRQKEYEEGMIELIENKSDASVEEK